IGSLLTHVGPSSVLALPDLEASGASTITFLITDAQRSPPSSGTLWGPGALGENFVIEFGERVEAPS
ncbi:MAG: hypothetical protein AAF597_10205, partial [Bacteroidota bacterium]